MNEMKTLPLAFTYVGVFLGAGFVSGPELWQFFGAFGNWGYVGFLLAAVLFTLFGILLVRLTQVAHTDEMDRLLVPWNIPWLRAASGIVAAAFLFGVVVIMAAGSGALLEQMTGLPTWIGNALFMLAVALVALLGVTGMVSAFSALIPVLVLATLAFAAAACIKFGTGNIFRLENVNTNPLMPTWLVASLTFVAYNLLGNSECPFIVETFACDVEVLGTHFDVIANQAENRFSTALFSGRVAVTNKKNGESVILQPNDIVNLRDGGFQIQELEDKDDYLWMDGIISVYGMPFEQLMSKLERSYNVKIEIRRETMPVVKYKSLKIRVSDGIDHALHMLQLASDFTFEHDAVTDVIIIK